MKTVYGERTISDEIYGQERALNTSVSVRRDDIEQHGLRNMAGLKPMGFEPVP